MKKFNIVLLIIFSFVLVSCSKDDNKIPGEYRVENTSFINLSNEYNTTKTNTSLHFMEDDVLPYIDIKDYFNLLDGVYVSSDLEFLLEGNILKLSYIYEYTNELEEVLEEVYDLEVDISNNILKTSNIDFFSTYLNETETNYSEGLINLPSLITKGSEVVYDIGKYNFEIIKKDNYVLMPLSITNLIFGQDNYFDLYYNGEKLYGIDTSDLDDNNLKEILKSNKNGIQVPEKMKTHTFNYYSFVLDYFYGLKEERNIISGSNFINKETFLKNDLSKNIFDLTIKLDDLHTGHITRGFYNNKRLDTSYNTKKFGTNVTNFNNGMDDVVSEAATHFGTDFFGYLKINDYDIEYIDNNKTLIIYVLGFDVDTPVEIENIIKNAKSTTENIIIDLSLNTGGNLGAVLRMFTLMTNNNISYHIKNPLNNETATFSVKGENKAYDSYTYYIKTSSITFSAANLTASIAKELGIKVIGRKSSGGASGLSFFVAPDGSIVYLSSNMVLTDSEYNSIELGINPDYLLNSLYSKTEIINSLSNE